ncbi:MAG: hypothetical protein KDD84_22940, partial [Caldilineaceae bacterium]|nr:hypothetical protein [Caldilineaceae bacterium]
MHHRFRQLLTIILTLAISLASTFASVTPAAAQGNIVTYGLAQDPANPLQITAVAYPNFTSTGSTISTALFTILMPAGTATTPSIPSLLTPPGSGSFTNITGNWQAQKVTEAEYTFVGADPADLEGYDVYQVALQAAVSSLATTAGEPIELFRFTLPADCSLLPVAVLVNDSSIQQSVLAELGANFNNQMSIKVGTAPAIDMYDSNDPSTGSVACPIIDTDGDGVGDATDLDDDNDGLTDAQEGDGAVDSDGDGTPDSQDLDSDDDGENDVIEAGGSDPDNDGVIGTGPITDTDGDGLADAVDTDDGGSPLTPTDTDGDGAPDFQESIIEDADSDGVPDELDADDADP